jgi:hypothetical protein
LVEHDLAKVGVASSSLVSRSKFCFLELRSCKKHQKAALGLLFAFQRFNPPVSPPNALSP